MDDSQTAHEVSDMQEHLNVEHDRGSDIVPNMTRDSRVKYITYYEDGVSFQENGQLFGSLIKVREME